MNLGPLLGWAVAALVAGASCGASAAARDGDTAPALRLIGAAETPSLGTFVTPTATFANTFFLEAPREHRAVKVAVIGRILSGPPGATAEITINGAPNRVRLGMVAARTEHKLRVAVSLPEPGAYRFALTVIGAGRRSYAFEVERLAPEIEVARAEGAVLALETDRSDFATQLVLRATGAAPVERVSVALPVLEGPGGTTVVPDLDGLRRTAILARPVSEREPGRVGLRARLPETGTYRGELTVAYAGGRKRYALTIGRTLAPSGLSAAYAGATEATLPLPLIGPYLPMLGAGTASFHVFLRATSGRALELAAPGLEAVKRQLGEAGTLSAAYTATHVFAADGRPIPSWPMTLGPDLPAADLRIDVAGLTTAGRYDGTLVLPVGDQEPVEVAVAFAVRHSGWLAAILILLGIGSSLLLRAWATSWRPLMVELRRVLTAINQLETRARRIAPARAEEREVLERLRADLTQTYDDLRHGVSRSADPVVATTRQKLEVLPAWVGRHRQLVALTPARYAAPLRAELDTVRAYLMTATPSDDEHAEARQTLRELPAEITKTLKQMVADFRSRVERLGDGLADANRQDEWKEVVVGGLRAAEVDLAAGALEAANRTIEGARVAAAYLLAGDLGARLPTDRPPAWMDVDTFEQITATLRAARGATEGDVGVAAYREALGLYLRPYALELASRIAAVVVDLRRRADPPAAVIDALTRQGAKLDAVPAKVAEGSLAEASAICHQAAEVYDQYRPAGVALALEGEAGVVRTALAEAPGGGDLPPLTLPLPFPLPDPTEGQAVERIAATTRALDWLFHLIVALVAVVLGVYVLWAGNPTWGSPGDMLLAILWGLGLHALTAGPAAYQGLADLVGRFRA